MTSWRQIKVVVPIVLLAGLVSLVTLSSSLVQAEASMVPPTPTNEARGGGGGGGG